MLAVSANAPKWREIFTDGIDDSVQAAVPMAPITNLDTFSSWGLFPGGNERDRSKELSPMTYVSEKSAPMLILHSKNDPLVPLSESQNIKAAYEKYGAKCDMIVYDSGDHAFWNLRAYNPLQLRSWNDAANFFDKTLKK